MKKLIKKLEDIMVAVTFAEAGEYDEASRQAGTTRPEEMLQPADFKEAAVQNSGK